MRKFPSTVKGGLAPGAASVGFEAASLGPGGFLSAALALASASGPAATRAGVPGLVGGRTVGWAAETGEASIRQPRARVGAIQFREFRIGVSYEYRKRYQASPKRI